VKLNNRELATVLAALRYWQRGLTDVVRAEAEHFDNCEPLTDPEIDALCERLNFGDTSEPQAKPYVIITVSGGVADVGQCPPTVDLDIIDYDNIEASPKEAAENLSDSELAFIKKDSPDTYEEVMEFKIKN
jgi:hypothetical protein